VTGATDVGGEVGDRTGPNGISVGARFRGPDRAGGGGSQLNQAGGGNQANQGGGGLGSFLN
jgi:hypothetical protein